MALRREESEGELSESEKLRRVYTETDPNGFDATGHASQVFPGRYPVEWSEVTSTWFGAFDLGWVGEARTVDYQAPHFPALWPRPSRTHNGPALFPRLSTSERWLKSGAFPRKRRDARGGQFKTRLTRTEARLIARASDDPNDERPDGLEPWEAQQDVAQFQRWNAKLPLTRNVRTGKATADTWAILLDAAGWVDTLAAYGDSVEAVWLARMAGTREQTRRHVDRWAFNVMLGDPDWLRAIYRLSAREGEAVSLYLHGFKQEAIATWLGVEPSTAKEFLDRARRKMRELVSVVPLDRTLKNGGA